MAQKQSQFKKNYEKFEKLIKQGKLLSKKAPSVRGCSLDDVPKSEQNCFKWYTEVRNFLCSLFGENFRDVITFRKCFGKYKTMNLMGFYSGDQTFIKEDMYKAVGILEGIYTSFKDKEIKQQNKVMIFFKNLYYELKDWVKIILKIKNTGFKDATK